MAGEFDSAAFEELKRQVEAWGLDDKQKGKFLMEEWRKMREAEEKKAERDAEEKKAEREAEEKRRKAEEKKAEREAERDIERLRIELETKRLEATSREKEQRTVAPFADGHDDLDNYLLRFERYTGVAGWEKQIWATQLSALLSGRALEVYSRLSQEDAMEYNVLKVVLLTRYNFIENGYRGFAMLNPLIMKVQANLLYV